MPSAPFELSRASSDDIAEITRIEYQCFPPTVRQLFMGCNSENDIPRMINKHASEMARDPHDVWIKVVDTTTGNIVAASNWKVFPNSAAPHTSDEVPPDWLEGEALQAATRIMSSMNDARRRANPGPHIHLHMCFTHPSYRRQGAGSMMVQWGCDLADELFLPVWIEASPEGNHLYREFDFVDVQPMAEGMGGMCMRRDQV